MLLRIGRSLARRLRLAISPAALDLRRGPMMLATIIGSPKLRDPATRSILLKRRKLTGRRRRSSRLTSSKP